MGAGPGDPAGSGAPAGRASTPMLESLAAFVDLVDDLRRGCPWDAETRDEAAEKLSAEHGIGQMKRQELGRLADPATLTILRGVKQALDPLGIMNPGKLVPLASRPNAP